MNHARHYVNAFHLDQLLPTESLRETLAAAVERLRTIEFAAIAFRGMSGALLAPSLALALDKTLLMVRKSTDYCHSSHMVEGDQAAARYIIVDDFISSGATVRAIVSEVKTFAPQARLVGFYSANHAKLYDAEDSMVSNALRPLVESGVL